MGESLQFVLKHYDNKGTLSTIDLQKYVNSITVRKSAEAKNNIMEVTLNNPVVDFFSDGTPRRAFIDSTGQQVFKATQTFAGHTNFEERVELYVNHTDDLTDSVENSDYLLFNGQIKEIKSKHEGKNVSIKLICSDRTFNILNRISSENYSGKTAPFIIKNLIRQKTENGLGVEQKYDDNGNVTTGDGYVIDARLFSEGLKGGTDAVAASTTKTITVATATFQTDGVNNGDMVRNMTTNQVALVDEVISETSLRLTKKIFASAANMQVSDGFIQDFRPDGTVFPNIEFGFGNKPLYEWISTLAQTGYTNTPAEIETPAGQIVKRPMRFYVDGKNRFHWFYPDDTESHIVKVGQQGTFSPDINEHRTYSASFTKGIFDVVNFIIFKAGEDMDGRQVLWYAQDPYAGATMVKDSFRPFLNVARTMKQEDSAAGNIVLSGGNDEYAYPTSYPVTPAWDTKARSVSNDSDYNTNFREEARRRGKQLAEAIIKQTANPRWKGSMSLRGEHFNPSDLCKITDRQQGVDGELMRINEAQHTINQGGWFVQLQVKADVPLETN